MISLTDMNGKLATLALLAASLPGADDAPFAEIGNGEISVKIYLPDAKQGFYRGTRFDWSGVLFSLQYKGHEYYGPWFQRTDPKIHDFVYDGNDIVAGPCSAITGPVDEFRPLGWDAAKPGETFLKIGVGTLRKPENGKYDAYRLYDIAEPGKWTVRKFRDRIEFLHQLTDMASGYSYVYKKTVRLVQGEPEMVLEHSLKNTGQRNIDTTVYNHNFLILDGQPPGPGLTITTPYAVESAHPPNKDLADIRGKQIVYLKALEGKDVVFCPVQGFGPRAEDNQVSIENSKLGIGMSIQGDRPLHSQSLWSIRSVMAIEPFVALTIEPGRESLWKSTYRYYTLPANRR